MQMETEMKAVTNCYRQDFPILAKKVNGKRLAYLDSAATTQKPKQVIDAIYKYYTTENANVHRGVHYLSELATNSFEIAREKVRKFINAKSTRECIFVRGATEGINLVANSFGALNIKAGDEILLSEMEHHANIIPWQLLCEHTGATIKTIPLQSNGELDLSNIQELINNKTKIVGLIHVSNSLGTVNPVKNVIQVAHAAGVPVLIDGTQAVPHFPVDMQELDCDFYVFSSHKMYGPTGVGVLYGKEEWLTKMPPYQGGGDMILSVSFTETIYNELPYKFEAGTPAIASVVGLGAAIDYLQQINWPKAIHHESSLLHYLQNSLSNIEGVTIYGNANNKIGVVSFTLAGAHPHDLGTIVDKAGVAIRTGHHCTMPVMDFFAVPGTARASIGIYNDRQDIDALVQSLEYVNKVFNKR